jgi:hypothetical protein
MKKINPGIHVQNWVTDIFKNQNNHIKAYLMPFKVSYISTKSNNPIKSYDIKRGTKSAKKKSPTRPT